MDLYVILRRNGWSPGDELQEAAGALERVGDGEMPEERSLDPQLRARRERGRARHRMHLRGGEPRSDSQARGAADLPADEIIPIADTVFVRPDPQPAVV